MRKTKIVCTIGPASQKVEVLAELLRSGMNVARLNMAHGDHDYHRQTIRNIREAEKLTGIDVAILIDIKGPEIRIGEMGEQKVVLEQDTQYILTTEQVLGDARRAPVNCLTLHNEVKKGDRILIDDGLICLEVDKVIGQDIICQVIVGGELKSKKNMNLPGTVINLFSLTDKDRYDLKLAIEEKLDFVAASFIQKEEDVLNIRAFLEENNYMMDIIAKIESREGIKNIDEIIGASDGIMVARGDLGVQLHTEEVPLAQKMLIKKCNQAGKPVITATQMLDSMIRNPMPTRAEASDVANAILDGTDAIMLSGETASGKYPVESLKMMDSIARKTEEALPYDVLLQNSACLCEKSVPDAICYATCQTANNLEAAAIITPTASGYTSQMVAKYRPKAPIIAVTPDPAIIHRTQLNWGVYSTLVEYTENTDEMTHLAIGGALKTGLIKYGDRIVITAGVPTGIQGTTNLLRVDVVAEIIARGVGLGQKIVYGRVKKGIRPEELLDKVEAGDILVTVQTDADFMPVIERAAAIITEEGGLTCHAAIAALERKIPVIVAAKNIMEKLNDDDYITLDSKRGMIYKGKTDTL